MLRNGWGSTDGMRESPKCWDRHWMRQVIDGREGVPKWREWGEFRLFWWWLSWWKKTRLEPFFSVIYKLYISIFDACLTGRGPTMMGAETQFFAAQSAVWSWRHGECWRCFYQANFNPLGSSSESSHCFAQWTQWNHLGLALWHGCWPQNSCTTFPGAMLPEACFK